jgi:hypothetical protein
MIRAASFLVVAWASLGACAQTPKAATAARVGGEGPERAIALKNPGFENAPRKSERCPEGWACTMHSNSDSFAFRIESPPGAQGKQALCVERIIHEPWALVTQAVNASGLHGASLRFSISLRVEGADGAGGGPWAVVHGPFGNLAHEERLLKSTDGWQRVAVDFAVPPAAQMVEVGATLLGGGRICIDDARLEHRREEAKK